MNIYLQYTNKSYNHLKLTQKREILHYLATNFKNEIVEQNDFVQTITINKNNVFAKGSKGNISNIYNFYRKELVDEGFIEIIKDVKVDPKLEQLKVEMQLKVERLQKHIQELNELYEIK